MVMPPRARKLTLVAHITTSVGWLGAVAAYLALDVVAATGEDPGEVRGAYLAMNLTVRYVILPLALASVLIGIINALGTPWGLIRHYWVVVKLGLTLVATTILLFEARTVADLADLAATDADPRGLPGTLVHSVGGLIVLFIITVLSVVKPRGLTPHGWRKQHGITRRGRREQREPRSRVSA